MAGSRHRHLHRGGPSPRRTEGGAGGTKTAHPRACLPQHLLGDVSRLGNRTGAARVAVLRRAPRPRSEAGPGEGLGSSPRTRLGPRSGGQVTPTPPVRGGGAEVTASPLLDAAKAVPTNPKWAADAPPGHIAIDYKAWKNLIDAIAAEEARLKAEPKVERVYIFRCLTCSESYWMPDGGGLGIHVGHDTSKG